MLRTVIVVRRLVERPLLGINFTTMMHFPFLIPRIVLPTKMQNLFPVKILMRITPSDCLGIDIDTALAIRAAVIERPL